MVRSGGPGRVGGARLEFQSARLELALIALGSGKIRFNEIDLEKPVVTLTRAADGALKLPALRGGEADAVGFERLSVRDGRLVVQNPVGQRTFDSVVLDAEAPSLSGPSRVTGKIALPNGAPLAFRLATERSGASGTPARLSVDSGPN